MAYIDICGKQIYYEEYGKENTPTLVYMHGGPGESCLTYTYQAQKLGERYIQQEQSHLRHCRISSRTICSNRQNL